MNKGTLSLIGKWVYNDAENELELLITNEMILFTSSWSLEEFPNNYKEVNGKIIYEEGYIITNINPTSLVFSSDKEGWNYEFKRSIEI